MSIAISAIVAPSRMLRLTLFAHALCNGAAGLFLLVRSGSDDAAGRCAGLACVLVALVAGARARRPETLRQIDISGVGELRVTVQQSMGGARGGTVLMRLLPGSTLWPGLLLLRLTAANGAAQLVLTVLPDSVQAGQFRALAVASAAIAARDRKTAKKNKIV